MEKSLIASKMLPLLSVLMCISLGCRKDKDDPFPDNSTSCKIKSYDRFTNFMYDQFGRLKRDEVYDYTYDSEGYLTRTDFLYMGTSDESLNEVTTYEYENGLLVKTTRKPGDERNISVQNFQYDNNKKLIGILINVSPINTLSLPRTYTFTFKDEKLVAYTETIKGITSAPHEFKDGKLVKSITADGYQEYEYDDLDRVTKRITVEKGKISSIKLSYHEGKSYLTSIPKFKGFPEFINNARHSWPLTPVPFLNDLADLKYLYKQFSNFTLEDGKEIEQSRFICSYTLNKEGLPNTMHADILIRNSQGILTEDPDSTPWDKTFTYIDCD